MAGRERYGRFVRLLPYTPYIILFKDYKVNANYLNSDIKAAKYPCLLCFFVLSTLR